MRIFWPRLALLICGLTLSMRAGYAADEPDYFGACDYIRTRLDNLVARYHGDPYHATGAHGPWNRPGNLSRGINHVHLEFALPGFFNDIIFWKNADESCLRYQCKDPGPLSRPTVIPMDLELGIRLALQEFNSEQPLDQRVRLRFNDELAVLRRRSAAARRGFVRIQMPDPVARFWSKRFAEARPGIAGGIGGFGIGLAAEHATTGALESCGVSHENAQHAGMASGFGSGWIAEEVITARLGGARPFTVGGAGGLIASGPLAAVATHIHIMNSEICPNVIAASEGNLQSAAQPLASGWVGAELERLNLANSIAEQNAMMDVLSVGGLGAYGYGIRSSLDSITETLDGAERCVSDFAEEWLPEVYNVRDLSQQPRYMMLPGGVRATRCY